MAQTSQAIPKIGMCADEWDAFRSRNDNDLSFRPFGSPTLKDFMELAEAVRSLTLKVEVLEEHIRLHEECYLHTVGTKKPHSHVGD